MRFLRVPINHLAVISAAVWLPTICIPLLIFEWIENKNIKWDNSEDIRAITCISLLAIFSPILWLGMSLAYCTCDKWVPDNKWSRTKFVCMYRELFVRGSHWFWHFDEIDGHTAAARDNMVELISKVTRKKFKRGYG